MSSSGGIGPTHDDVTLKAIASALGQKIKGNIESFVRATFIVEIQTCVTTNCSLESVKMMTHLQNVHSENMKYENKIVNNIVPEMTETMRRSVELIVCHESELNNVMAQISATTRVFHFTLSS
jgi:hypothetical protein